MGGKAAAMKRFLESRGAADRNAKTLATLIGVGRGVSAVIIPEGRKEYAGTIMPYSGLTYFMAEVNGSQLLMFPTEEEPDYQKIKPELILGGPMETYGPFTIAEEMAAMDFMDEVGLKYKIKQDTDGRFTIGVPAQDTGVMDRIVEAIQEEESTDIGRRQYESTNMCWEYAIGQAAKAIEYSKDKVAAICSETGTGCIRLDPSGAYVVTPGEEVWHIPRDDLKFERKIFETITDAGKLGGMEAPVKAFFGPMADAMTKDVGYLGKGRKAPTQKEARAKLALKAPPKMDKLMEKDTDGLSEEEQIAFYTAMRNAMCRETKTEGMGEARMDNAAWEKYGMMHENNARKIQGWMEENLGIGQGRQADSRGEDGNGR